MAAVADSCIASNFFPNSSCVSIAFSPNLRPPEDIVRDLAAIEDPLDIYCWYEGTHGLPEVGARFMREALFEPLYRLKKNAKLYLYSLKAWGFKKPVSQMRLSSSLGEEINRINKTVVECLYSSSFFQYCTQVPKENALYCFINRELPQKKWLFDLSEKQKKQGMKVASLFENQSSLFDCIQELDVSSAYSSMQYIEGYYLLRESVKKALLRKQPKIVVAFVLPNDEGKYYLDFPKDLERMLRLDFGKEVDSVEISLVMQFFQYGESVTSRPYIDKRPKPAKVKAEEIGSYFDYLFKPEEEIPFLRDVIHDINGWKTRRTNV